MSAFSLVFLIGMVDRGLQALLPRFLSFCFKLFSHALVVSRAVFYFSHAKGAGDLRYVGGYFCLGLRTTPVFPSTADTPRAYLEKKGGCHLLGFSALPRMSDLRATPFTLVTTYLTPGMSPIERPRLPPIPHIAISSCSST